MIDLHHLRCALLICLVSSLCCAEDRVSYTPAEGKRPITLVGEVLDVTGRQVIIQTANNAKQSLPIATVQGIETIYQPAHLRGIEQLELGESQAALASFREAVRSEPRQWVQRDILAWMIKAAQREQNLAVALECFREIIRTDPTTRHWEQAPLIWTPQPLPESIRSDARIWLMGHSPTDRLLGASLLLQDPAYAQQAEKRLRELSQDENGSVAALSKTQLWRLGLAAAEPSEPELESWKRQIESLPRELRSGPQALLARGYELRGLSRRAAAEALWIPLVYPENELLAARALFDAGSTLERTGLTSEAENLFRELQQRYPWSREAALARSKRPS
ncbi:tetratricopeptide repeat protein [Planctomicrobium sp. SH664]|uniref:tetratricopeptide repeat protein n=1 Tax=Planctomicrobium sp. SH664 TaxID=3448125 RepID=UPI003F5C5444